MNVLWLTVHAGFSYFASNKVSIVGSSLCARCGSHISFFSFLNILVLNFITPLRSSLWELTRSETSTLWSTQNVTPRQSDVSNCFVDNHVSRELWTNLTLTRKGITNAKRTSTLNMVSKVTVTKMWSQIFVVNSQPPFPLLQQWVPIT